MKKIVITVVLLLCLAVVICGIAGIVSGAVWIEIVTFALSLLFHCLPIIIYRYLIKRKPVKNAKQISLWYGVPLVLFGLRDLPGGSIAGTIGIAAGAAINYLMLSE